METQQKQVAEGKHPTFSVKVTQDVYDLVNILCEGLQHGTNGNDLVKMFIHSFIESAKHDGPATNETRMFMNMLKLDPSWHKAFNFADVTAQTEVAQVILVLQQRDRHGFGLKMIDKPFMGETTETMSVDDILDRVIHIAMPDLARQIDEVGQRYSCRTMRETLTLFSEYMIDALNRAEEENDLPGYGEYHDFGRAIEYGRKTKGYKHRTPDSDTQQRIIFDDYDREVADYEVQDWEGERCGDHGDGSCDSLFEENDQWNRPHDHLRPFDVEW